MRAPDIHLRQIDGHYSEITEEEKNNLAQTGQIKLVSRVAYRTPDGLTGYSFYWTDVGS
jgi:hypothetical protein